MVVASSMTTRQKNLSFIELYQDAKLKRVL